VVAVLAAAVTMLACAVLLWPARNPQPTKGATMGTSEFPVALVAVKYVVGQVINVKGD